jgi:hypothetical protein
LQKLLDDCDLEIDFQILKTIEMGNMEDVHELARKANPAGSPSPATDRQRREAETKTKAAWIGLDRNKANNITKVG